VNVRDHVKHGYGKTEILGQIGL